MKRFLIFSLLLLTSCQQQLIGLFQKGEYMRHNEVIEVPFTVENGLMIIPVDIEGEMYRFLFDTGAPNVVSTELSERLKLKKSRSIKTVDSQGNESLLDYVRVQKINISGAAFVNTTAAVADLKQAEAIACLNIDGLIGANLMRKAFWQIDSQKNVIRIASDFDQLTRPVNGYVVPFTTEVTGTPLIHLRMGHVDVKKLKMDTGSVGFLSTDSESYNGLKSENQILAERSSYGASSVGLFGTSENDTIRQVLVKELSMGNLSVTGQVIDMKRSKSSLLGMSFLRNYLVTIDWKNNLVYLYPQGEFQNAYAESFGISLFKEGDKMVVSLIADGSSAQQQGIKVGDVVLRVNDVDVAHTTLEEYCKIIKLVRVKEVETLQIVLDRNGGKDEYFLTKMPPLSGSK
ncbi:aspartyl protease family protein [Crocinitomicaceae bacterium CZZ-1]|uniref:Aspartyl protease family protein n=1 Tax=Taishania pollutisoli TaxID=2766479 RepID=A0A8J6TTW8_9FLAO|nr:aspartyl protease family protein [Taishania pollutisoli]MBC9813509.1 aspartyl protease family protein [Taishania pollutisoli]